MLIVATPEVLQALNTLADIALKSHGLAALEAVQIVQQACAQGITPPPPPPPGSGLADEPSPAPVVPPPPALSRKR